MDNMQTLLNSTQLQLTITRLSHQLLEDASAVGELVFIGLQPRGIFISNRIMEVVKTLTNNHINYGKLDITFYRDDFRSEFHKANNTDISFSLEGRKVILIDDVLYTGRTIRAALDALMDFGRPKDVKLCVLVNRRFNREFPIQPDYCGIAIDTITSQKVKVNAIEGEVVLY
jgi:pyrimidine operon attenuation protein/uracil phosphoribosyltransferase